ncbi:RDD family protein [Frigoribacterium sp. PvP032]|uniref:RDD family protein n=1 Tax=Frigoribacterium sp. PvP032 TaxID=2806589 RepID=UPI001AE4D142|nr:RDD family protein [Frigoribacterium sp. PvP032]MBP1190199.1 putative RDD family membrane protein YckC [Frigoribacterium sp. PvP032]
MSSSPPSDPTPPPSHGGWGHAPSDEPGPVGPASPGGAGGPVRPVAPAGPVGPIGPGAAGTVVAPVPVVQLGPGERWAGLVVAGVGRRIAALAIDVVLSVAVLYGTLFAAVLVVPDPAVEAWAVPTAFFSAELAWLAGLGVAVGLVGRTPGMALLGLRVVHDSDPRRTVGVGRALLRGLVVFPLGLAWIWLLLLLLSATSLDPTGRRRGWHDRAARSQVLDVRRGADPVADPSWRAPDDRPVLVRLA